MKGKPMVTLSTIIVAAVASVFAAKTVKRTYLYQPLGSPPGFYTTMTSDDDCTILNQTGCLKVIGDKAQMHTVLNGIVVPVDRKP
jgi:hypothetical protein